METRAPQNSVPTPAKSVADAVQYFTSQLEAKQDLFVLYL